MHRKLENGLNVADWISIYRLVAAPGLLVLIWFEARTLFGLCLMISFFSDALDGFVARRMNTVTSRGAQLDSIGDAVTIIVAVIGVISFETAFMMDHLALVSTALSLFFLQLSMAFIRYGRPSSFHTYLAKAAAIAQGSFIFWLFFVEVEPWLFFVAVILGIIETIEEIILTFLLPVWRSDIKGLFWVLSKSLLKNQR